MNFSEFQSSTQSPSPVYLLITDQGYLKKRVYEHCRNQVEEGARAFNWAVFDLEKDSVGELVNVARTLPWMASRRWIYVQNVEVGDSKLAAYLQNPLPHTVLILDVRRKSARWPSLPVIEMSAKSDPVRWVRQEVKKEGYTIENEALQAVVELVGEDYQVLAAELEKLFLRHWESRRIVLDSVLEMTFQARQYDIFALIGALAGCQSARALRILTRLYEKGMMPPQIISMLYWNFRRLLVAREMLDRKRPFRAILTELKIWSYKGKEEEIRHYPYHLLVNTLLQLRETDRLCKMTSTDPKIHLERVIVDTCRKTSV